MEEFLAAHQTTQDDNSATLVDLIGYQRYKMTDNEAGEFWRHYCKAVEDYNQMSLAHMLKPTDSVQLGFNVNLKFDANNFNRLTDMAHSNLLRNIDKYVHTLIAGFQDIIMKSFQLHEGRFELISCYLRHKLPQQCFVATDKARVEFSARVIFPYAKVNYGLVGEFYTFAETQMRFSTSKCQEIVGLTITNDYDTMSFLSGKHWLLYGSCQSYSAISLPLYKIISCINDDAVIYMEADVAFNLNHHPLITCDVVDIGDEDYVDYWLALIFTPEFYEHDMIVQDGLFNRKHAPAPNISQVSNRRTDKLEDIKTLVAMLSHKHVSDRCSWIDIGQAIFSSLEGSNEALDIFKNYTMKALTNSNRYRRDNHDSDDDDDDDNDSDHDETVVTDEDCDIVWSEFYDTYSDMGRMQYTRATLEWMVKQDSPQSYECYREAKLRTLLFEALSKPETGTIGALFKTYFPFDYLYDTREKLWYRFVHHHWIPCDETDILNTMNEDFVQYLCEKNNEYSNKLLNSQNPEFRAQNINVSSLINNLLIKMMKINFKKQLFEELKVRYACSWLHNYMDRNRDLFGCRNGVIDLRCVDVSRGIKPRFRFGKPEDYIHKHGTEYKPDYHWDHPDVKECMKYVSEVFRNSNVRNFFWRFMSSLLKGGNTDKKYINHVGGGDNSKTALHRLIEKAYKSYFCTSSTTYLTMPPKGADAPDPVMSRIINCRYVVFPEPNINEIIQEGTLKRITGRDDVTYRDLFQKGNVMKTEEPMFKTGLVSNQDVKVFTQQPSFWNRALKLEYLSAWVDESELRKQDGSLMSYEEQYSIGKFLRNDDFERKLPKMAPAFLWLCVEYYLQYCEIGLAPPAEVLAATEEYKTACNYYRRFIRDCLERDLLVTDQKDSHGQPVTVINDASFVTVNECYTIFRKWFYDLQSRNPIPEKADFIVEMERVMRKKTSMTEDNQKVFTGFKLSASISSSSASVGGPSAGGGGNSHSTASVTHAYTAVTAV